MCKQMEEVRSSQASISINFTELSKTFFPVSIVCLVRQTKLNTSVYKKFSLDWKCFYDEKRERWKDRLSRSS